MFSGGGGKKGLAALNGLTQIFSSFQKQPFADPYSQKNTCVEISFNKVAGLQACNFIKKRLQLRCFPVNIA